MNNMAKEAIEEIRKMCWDFDIPSPCCPEYREHHEQMQEIMGLCDEWLKKLKEEGDEEWHAEVDDKSVEYRHYYQVFATNVGEDGKRGVHGCGSAHRDWCKFSKPSHH